MSKNPEALNIPAGTAAHEPPQLLAVLERLAIVRSKTNPRTHFDAAYIADLAASIKEHGILQPILVRPLPATRLEETVDMDPRPGYEIICGECRWRACGEAGIEQIPVLVRHLDDLQVLQVQLVENLKRRDLHPLEEAEGFDRLMHDHYLTVADIAARIDKSESYIYKALKLLELTAECRARMYEGKLSQSVALLVARAPAHLQLGIANEIMRPQGVDDEPMSFRQAARHIQQHYMLQLAHAVFDIKSITLVPKAGACSGCSKNTGSSTDLFADVAGGDTCTDPKCFDAKKVAHFAQVARDAEARGQTVIQGKEAKELIAFEGGTPKGYRLLDEKGYIDGRMTSLRAAIGKGNVPTPVIIIDPHTKAAVEALPVEVASKLLAKAAKEKPAAKDKGPTKEALEREYTNAWQAGAVKAIGQALLDGKLQQMTVEIARHIALFYVETSGFDGVIAEVLGLGKVGHNHGLQDFIKTCPPDKVAPTLLMLMVGENFDQYSTTVYPVAELLAEETGVDLDAVKAQVKADMVAAAKDRVAQAEEKADKPKPAPKGKAKKTTAAQAKAGISAAFNETDAKFKAKSMLTAVVTDAVILSKLAKSKNPTVDNRDDLANLTVDELVAITGQTADEAKALITAARENWFTGPATASTTWPFPATPKKLARRSATA